MIGSWYYRVADNNQCVVDMGLFVVVCAGFIDKTLV